MADENKEKTESKAKKVFTTFLLVLIACEVGAYILVSYLNLGTVSFNIIEVLSAPNFGTFAFLGFLVALVIVLTHKFKFNNSGASVKSKSGLKKYFDTNWLTLDEMRKNPDYKFHYYDDLHRSDNIGIPIRAQLMNGKLEVNMYKSIHTMVIGSTGAGKTTQFINPTVQILSESHAGPCFVITDPKGEIHDLHSEKLKKKGYKVMVFDLKEPFQSTRWNPLTRAYELYQRALNLNKEVKVHHNDDPRDFGLKCTSQVYYGEWYEFDGFAFADVNALQSHMETLKQQLKDKSNEEIKDIASVICPIESSQDPIWDRGARDLVQGILLAMLEDSENPELGMTVDKFNFFNMAQIANMKDNDAYNQLKSLTDYFQGRDSLSQACQLANQVLTNADKTKMSYMGIVSNRMGLFTDMGVCYATSANEMDLKTFADQPSAIFIKIPDEKTTRHPIATMFISQLYKILVDVANNRGGALPRDVYFLLDEFANMPKIEGFDTIITVARSRRIYFTLILQSYAQLDTKYGKEMAYTIKDNCNIHVFIASNDDQTKEEFSKKCGNITVQIESTSVGKSTEGKNNVEKSEGGSKNISVTEEQRPLIYPAELSALKPNSGECIITILQRSPIRSVFTPSYMCSVYDIGHANESVGLPNRLNVEEIYYDIRKRNAKILGNQTGSDNMGGGGGFNF